NIDAPLLWIAANKIVGFAGQLVHSVELRVCGGAYQAQTNHRRWLRGFQIGLGSLDTGSSLERVLFGWRFAQSQDSFATAGQKQCVALTSRQKFCLGVGLPPVRFEAQWQPPERIRYT